MSQDPCSDDPDRRVLLSLGLLVLLASLVTVGSMAGFEPEPSPTGAGSGYPKVRFDYGFVPFDRACSKATGKEIPQEQIAELESRLASFQEHWDEEGPRLLEATIAATGKPFIQQHLTAVMSLCDFPSMSHPLLLNMRRFLNSGPEDPPRSKSSFLSLVFHELLHIYVTETLEKSPLIEKYADEPGSVKSHMHLMAIMKKVYLQLGLEDELAELVAKDAGRPIYARSWQIVNELEGYQPFVDELKAE